MSVEKYNPLDPRTLARNIAREIRKQDRHPLPPKHSFDGAGIYLLYYTGKHNLYSELATQNVKRGAHEWPIYVGKADPKGIRKGAKLYMEESPAIYERLQKHRRQIESVQRLSTKDFFCKFLVMDHFWIRLAETSLIELYQPVWNTIADGFGNNAAGSGREKQSRSKWDLLHPNTGWSRKLTGKQRHDTNQLQIDVADAVSNVAKIAKSLDL